ncbi:MAG: DVU0298 family protein [Desulfosudaceae bacterium]
MMKSEPSNRALKAAVGQWLAQTEYTEMPAGLARHPARRLINPLLSFLYDREARVKWHAVTAIGQLVAGLADRELESARVIMRRLMWNLNDESGGIGWGSPEAMADIMAGHQRLADEFHAILISYLDPGKNFLEHEGLQPGVLWGVGRLARSRNSYAAAAAPLLPPFLVSDKATVRGHAAWAAVALDSPALAALLAPLAEDRQEIDLYRNQRLERIAVGTIVQEGTGQ